MSQLTPLSEITFILPRDHPQKDLYFQISRIVFEDEFLQIELSAYHIWNCVFHYGDNRSHWPAEEIISGLPLDSVAWIEQETKRGKQLYDVYKKSSIKKQAFFIHHQKLSTPVIPTEWSEQKTPRKFQADILSNFEKNSQSGIYNIRGGAGKTLLALWIFLKEPCTTLVIVPKRILIQQWWQELANLYGQGLDEVKTIFGKKLFILTHNQLSSALNEIQYHKIIIDEVHHIDGAMLEVLSHFMGKIIGLTATPHFSVQVHRNIFTVIGPMLFVYDYRQEEKGFKKQIKIVEVEIEMKKEEKIKYYSNNKKREKFMMASCAEQKVDILKKLLTLHSEKKIVVIGYFNQQLASIARLLKLPFYSSKISEEKKLKLLEEFNQGKINTLLMSSVGNEGINMPEVSTVIQISGNADDSTEEFQRLGRLTRDKEGELIFYTLITKGTIEEASHSKRKIELAKNGFNYEKKLRHL